MAYTIKFINERIMECIKTGDRVAKKREKSRKREWFNFERAMFLLVILLFIAIIQGILNPKFDLAKEAEIVLDNIADGHSDLGILSSNELTDERIRNLNNRDYMELKRMLGVQSDFCIFFEDITGNLVQVDGIKTGIGSDKISINGQPCE